MSASAHVRGIGRDLSLIKCAYALGTRDGKDLRATSRLFPSWSLAARTAYVYAKLLEAPNFVTGEEMDMADWQLLSSLLLLRNDEADAGRPRPPDPPGHRPKT